MSEEKIIKDENQILEENQTKSEEIVEPQSSLDINNTADSGISQEEADAIAKGLEGLDAISDNIPDIPDLEKIEAKSPEDVLDTASIDDIIASVKATSNFNFENPSSSVPESPQAARPASFPQIGEMSLPHIASDMDGVGMNLLMDIPVKISVVLGRARMTIGEILSLEPGAVVELDKLVGEPVEILANGKLILKGEVVVIDENFGIRVTELVDSGRREQTIISSS